MSKPKIRFKGYEEDWEQRKLGDVTELKSASRVHKGEWTDSGVPFFRSSDVMAAINGTTNEKAYISEELYEKLSNASGKLEEGDVLVTGGGSVGNPYIVPNNEPLYTKDADLLWIKNQGRFYPYFLYEYFFSPTFRIYLSSISHVGTIAHYTITQLSETPISLPDIEEQIKVGEYFESLDRLITLHQRKYEELQKIKKFMLQNMFI
jgi:type I restriction enzyme S subunit